MPRITNKRIETPKLQGEGSYVVFRRILHGAAQKARRFIMFGDVRERADLTVEQIDEMLKEEADLTLELVLNGVLDWNWQDENGNPLPLPKNSDDLDKMTAEEVQFILTCCAGNYPNAGDEAKN